MEWFNYEVGDRSKVVGGAQRIETTDGYVFPLFIESGLVYMHSIWVPTDADLQQYPHVFFMSPDIWDASVLAHGNTPALLEEIHQEADNSLLKDSMFDSPTSVDVFWDSSPTEPGDHTFHAHLHQSNPAEEDWKSVRTFPGGMNLLLLIQSLVIHLPSMKAVPWSSSLLERIL